KLTKPSQRRVSQMALCRTATNRRRACWSVHKRHRNTAIHSWCRGIGDDLRVGIRRSLGQTSARFYLGNIRSALRRFEIRARQSVVIVAAVFPLAIAYWDGTVGIFRKALINFLKSSS